MKILVTGNCGFIAQNFVRMYKDEHEIVGIDMLGYAHDPNAKTLCKTFEQPLCKLRNIEDIPTDFDAIVHMAAESHVDNSIASPAPFVTSNVGGTFQVLEFMRDFNIPRLVHISTDEVYGDLEVGDPPFSNDYQLKPSSPYSATKAAADMLIMGHHRTYGLDVTIVRPCNNYGPFQHKEKLIPVVISNALKNKEIPLYGTGMNIREWMFVEDNCRGIMAALEKGRSGEIYNLGSGVERTNRDLIQIILDIMGKPPSLIRYVKDRKGHDKRYALDSLKSYKNLDWHPSTTLEEGLQKTIEWYVKNPNYWEES